MPWREKEEKALLRVINIEWYEELDFSTNPLETDAFKSDLELTKLEEETKELIYRISAGSIVLIVGKEGYGKTILLRKAIENFKGRGKVIYIDGKKLQKNLDIEKLLLKKYSVINSLIFRRKPKNMILLLDNLEELSKKNSRLIKHYYDEDYIKSVVFATSDPRVINLDYGMLSRIENRIIKLKPITEHAAIKLIENRIGQKLITTDALKEIYALSGKSVKEMLANTELILKSKKKNPAKADIQRIIAAKKQEKKEPDLCETCEGVLIEINGYWRCPECDKYCEHCGAALEEEDLRCPDCNRGVGK